MGDGYCHDNSVLLLLHSECADCLNGGNCNSTTKMCDCGQAFDGPDCRKPNAGFQSHAPDIESILYSFFFLVAHSGCENRALYNSITGQCDCMPGNSGPLCGECRVVESHMSSRILGGVCTYSCI